MTVKLARYVDSLVKEREEAKISKNWERADEIRAQLKKSGITIKDTPDGPLIDGGGTDYEINKLERQISSLHREIKRQQEIIHAQAGQNHEIRMKLQRTNDQILKNQLLIDRLLGILEQK